MWPLELFLVTVLSFSSQVSCLSSNSHAQLRTRNLVTESTDLADSYDFIIVGGGLAGLVLASRLSEDSNTTVLVIEAGESGDAVATQINTPADTYYNSLVGSAYDWAFNTVAQAGLSNRALYWPRGKTLGGSSAINGMYLVHPSDTEINAWHALIAANDTAGAADNWSWDSFYAAMKKSETFDAPSADIEEAGGIIYTASAHGTDGPVHYGYPGYMFPIVGNWTPTLDAYGIPPNADAFSGSNNGAYVANSAINPSNWTRSDSRAAYIDPLPPRSNLDILTGNTVTRIIFAADSTPGNLTANSVEYGTASGATLHTVNVTREVILAGGALGSPQVLMLSGVGPKDVLDAAGVAVNVELPGVGQHLQDHLSAGIQWDTTIETMADIYNSGSAESLTPEYLSFVNAATAYVNATMLLGSDAASALSTNVTSALSTIADTTGIVPSQYSEVVAGYKAIYEASVNTIFPSAVGQVEILLSINTAAKITIQAAIQHPLSQGRVYINSSSAFDHPLIDPNYMSHYADLVIMREGLKTARAIGQTAPISNYVGTETYPGSSVSTDDEWDAWLEGAVGTEYHPGSSCAMLPLEQGGVVDSKLQVYGLANVRVVDASVFPISFSAHLMGATYGLAEQASTMIRAFYNGVAVTKTTSTATNSTSSSGSSLTTAGSATKSDSGASSLTAAVPLFCGAIAMIVFGMSAL